MKDNTWRNYRKLVCEVDYNNEADFGVKFSEVVKSSAKVDAVLFSTDTFSILGLKLLQESNIRIPDDTGGCFDESGSYDLFYWPISYVKQAFREIGKTAVEILLLQ